MTGWTIGFTLGALVVIVVVVLLLLLIAGARRAAAKAEAILAALVEARDNTQGLWAVAGTNVAAGRIVAAAGAARKALSGEGDAR